MRCECITYKNGKLRAIPELGVYFIEEGVEEFELRIKCPCGKEHCINNFQLASSFVRGYVLYKEYQCPKCKRVVCWYSSSVRWYSSQRGFKFLMLRNGADLISEERGALGAVCPEIKERYYIND